MASGDKCKHENPASFEHTMPHLDLSFGCFQLGMAYDDLEVIPHLAGEGCSIKKLF